MSECIALDARKVFLNASKAFSKRKHPCSKARAKQSLGSSMVGARSEAVQSAGTLRRHAQERSGSTVGRHPATVQRKLWPPGKTHLHLPSLRGRSFSSRCLPEMEGVNARDH